MPSSSSNGASASTLTMSESITQIKQMRRMSQILDPRSNFDLHFHIAVVGNNGVGKTTLIKAEIKNQQGKNPWPTIPDSRQIDFEGIHFTTCFYEEPLSLIRDTDLGDPIIRNYRVKVTYWDVPGAQETLDLACLMASGVAGIVYIADITNRLTFDDLTVWMLGLESQEPILKTIIGNKCDLKGTEHSEIESKIGHAYALKLNSLYYEASAKDGIGISYALQLLRNEILQKINAKPISQLRQDIFKNRVEVGPALLEKYSRLPRVEAPIPELATSEVIWL